MCVYEVGVKVGINVKLLNLLNKISVLGHLFGIGSRGEGGGWGSRFFTQKEIPQDYLKLGRL